MVLPGGAAELVDYKNKMKTTPFMNRIHKIIEYIKDRNDRKDYYPIWGTCLGFEELIVSSSGLKGESLQNGFDDRGKYHEVSLRDEFWNSRFFGHLPVEKKIINEVFSKPIAYYYHSEGIEPQHFKKFSKLVKDLTILGTSKNDAGREYIALLEHKKYPIFFAQFHPEKHQFEKRRSYIPMDRSQSTIKLMTSFIFKLVNDVRKNAKSFEDIPSSVAAYFPYYKMPIWSPVKSFERIYMFKNYFSLPEDDQPKRSNRRLLMDH